MYGVSEPLQGVPTGWRAPTAQRAVGATPLTPPAPFTTPLSPVLTDVMEVASPAKSEYSAASARVRTRPAQRSHRAAARRGCRCRGAAPPIATRWPHAPCAAAPPGRDTSCRWSCEASYCEASRPRRHAAALPRREQRRPTSHLPHHHSLPHPASRSRAQTSAAQGAHRFVPGARVSWVKGLAAGGDGTAATGTVVRVVDHAAGPGSPGSPGVPASPGSVGGPFRATRYIVHDDTMGREVVVSSAALKRVRAA